LALLNEVLRAAPADQPRRQPEPLLLLDNNPAFRYHAPNEFPDKGALKGRMSLARSVFLTGGEAPLH